MTEEEKTFFLRALPDFERRVAGGESPADALTEAAKGVVARDEEILIALYNSRRTGAMDDFRAELSARVYRALRERAVK